MKRLVLLLLISVIAQSCEKVFKNDSQNTLTINNADDLESAVASLNYRFKNSIDYLSFNSDDMVIITQVLILSQNNCQQSFFLYDIPFETTNLWETLFQTVICANDILNKSLHLNRNNPDIKKLLGEVYFMRAFTYFRLVRYFGQVPVIDNVDVSYTVKKAGFNEIYNFILSDLQNAIAMLPASNNNARIKYVTSHRGTAKALMAEVFLSMGGYPLKQHEMYAMAASIAKEVIDSAWFYGYRLLPDFAGLWDRYNEKNDESVFALYFTNGANYAGFNSEFYASVNNGSNSRDIPFDGVFSIPLSAGVQFYNTFPDSYRKKLTYRVNKYLNPGTWENLDTSSLPATANLCNNPLFRKFYFTTGSQTLNQYLGCEVYLIRYANTLLTYAEAKARSGSLDASAYDAVNQVRRRANKTDLLSPSKFDLQMGLTTDQFTDSVVWERAFELCGEPENREFDLLRLEMLNQLPKLRFPGQGYQATVLIDSVSHFFPIPETDKLLNINLD